MPWKIEKTPCRLEIIFIDGEPVEGLEGLRAEPRMLGEEFLFRSQVGERRGVRQGPQTVIFLGSPCTPCSSRQPASILAQDLITEHVSGDHGSVEVLA